MGDSLETLRTLRDQALDAAAAELVAAREAEKRAEREVQRRAERLDVARVAVERFRTQDAEAAQAARLATAFVMADAHLRVLSDEVRDTQKELGLAQAARAEAAERVARAVEALAGARADLRAVEKAIERRADERALVAARRVEAES